MEWPVVAQHSFYHLLAQTAPFVNMLNFNVRNDVTDIMPDVDGNVSCVFVCKY